MRRHHFNWCAAVIHYTNIVCPFANCLQVHLEHVHFAFVVPLEQQDHEVEEADEEGPKWVVSLFMLWRDSSADQSQIMNATVYQQSNLIPPVCLE
jgi:hypothetical protein